MTTTGYNRLKDEKSAYLQQHKENPVHWYPWGPEAIQKSKDENKPIFLSVGYSSCHWCHVMAGESFSDQETADFLNENFISIKVDREEFPDIDSYYQQACQLFIQSGGWPLNAFLMPDLKPYFVGTYYPKERTTKEGATFLELLHELKRAYTEENDKVVENAKNVTETIKNGMISKDKVEYPDHFPPPMAIVDAVAQFADYENGGYGNAPKFPHFPFYEWATEQMLEGMITKEKGQHIVDSIEKMLMGGIIDQARGGIHRYSTDEKYLIPHFEKMLYDQAGLLSLLGKFSLLYPSPQVYDTIIKTLEYLENEMLGEDKYFFSAQDADSEGVEGLYFTFTKEEFEDILNKVDEKDEWDEEKRQKIIDWFNIEHEGNFNNKLNVLSLNFDKRDEFYNQDTWDIVRNVCREALNQRKMRIPPATDSKGVASWNFQLISGLVDVIQYCQIDLIKQRATALFNVAVEGVYNNFLIAKNTEKMTIRHTNTKEQSLPYLEDYVTFAHAQLRIYEITGNDTFKDNLRETIEFITKEFVDLEKGEVLTRAKSANEFELYPNQVLSYFDSSFRSQSSSFVSILRRSALLLEDNSLMEGMDQIFDDLKNMTLKNPISAGEGLRASTYPDNAYRIVKVPRKWLDDGKYVGFIGYFLPRFTLSYHNDENDTWQICNANECELTGEGVDNFIETLRPTQNQKA
ncbi:MAG: thioredoxin domain-containing protein [Oligoflexia bacterium]|nr:thioredoxin domain-containing protein [Oligoflexia bacterium]